ncbi:protease SohB [Pseudoalteromonas phenolica]|uniref:protease SohB n=1 Tax=Pseudoalteromonas phenolica TaxID=161398 RepID=UPI00110C1213|nr:protease SohB [Pseudoalteromonas phenolica]TMO54220.1 protease SohB [Pseudoalteromonas phenolica]
MTFLFEYGLFLAKAITVVLSIGIIIILAVGASQKPKASAGEVELQDLSKKLKRNKQDFIEQTLDKKALKNYKKTQKKEQEDKLAAKAFVINFDGSSDANEVNNLREEITAVLQVADKDKDSVIVNINSGGGVVHGYGLGASQLKRLTSAKLPLTVCVDKIAASGGYMMACVANKIVAAPFSIIGSIGVIAQIPNFNKLLKKNDIDFEMITSGEFKRTLTIFGENTDKGRDKFQQEVESTHGLFKEFVQTHRQDIELEQVATGEYWFATEALKLGLVDELNTSDDYILSLLESHQIYTVKYTSKKSLPEKLGLGISKAVASATNSLWTKLQDAKW